MNANPFAGSRHADVLAEIPEDDDAKMRLVAELKNRGKGAFSQKDMPSAELLWGKAIEILATLPGKSEAALYSNRAMVRLNLSKIEGALEDSKKCIELDPKFVKAYHRKAQALLRLNEYDDAITAANEGAALEPDNKAFGEVIAQAEKNKAQDAEDKAKLKRDAQDVRVELHNASTSRASTKAAQEAKEKKEGEEDTSMRGYKVRADGKKTSYFHTDISDEAKALIEKQGFGKPTKLDAPTEEAAAKGGGSQWNQAGTYEEKGMKKWWDSLLRENLIGVTFTIPDGSGNTIKTIGVQKIEGDASISVSRGKRRHLLDLSFEVEFEGTIGDATGKGKLCISEVTSGEDDAEVKVEIDQDTPPVVREVFNSFVKSGGQGLQPLVVTKVRNAVEEYKKC